jgi:hypothetical protein
MTSRTAPERALIRQEIRKSETGLRELRRLVLDRRYMDPERFAHLRQRTRP